MYSRNRGGVDQSKDLPTSWESERLKTALTQDYGKTIDNYRIQRLMDILPMKKGKATAENIPSKPDRSMFSCERYQFFLDAPFEISQHCCSVMKKAPAKAYSKRTKRQPMTAEMASESRLRTQIWLKQGCNAFDSKKPKSMPLSFWTEADILYYIYLHGDEMIEARKRAFEAENPDFTESELAEIYANGEWGAICSVYGDIIKENEVDGQIDWEDFGLFDMGRPQLKTTGAGRTGCFACLFGIQLEKEPNRLQRMKVTHPKLYKWLMKPEEEGGMGYKDKIDWINEHGGFHIKY